MSNGRPIWVEIVCACCARTTSNGWVYGRLPRKKLYDAAEKKGWRYMVHEPGGMKDWVCRNCDDDNGSS